MHQKHFNYPLQMIPEDFQHEISEAYQLVHDKIILPSMRSLQFAGAAIEMNESRGYNCAYLPIDHYKAFSETMYLLLGGTGVGYSVESRNINELPPIQRPGRSYKYVIEDSTMGWAEAVRVLVKSYMYGTPHPNFVYNGIREKGMLLITSGGKAPGPEPLEICLTWLDNILQKAIGRQLSSLEAHDILCHIADAVLSGGIRRAAMIAFFDVTDRDMALCKSANWLQENPQRQRANNSMVAFRDSFTKENWDYYWNCVKQSGWGEPGIFWTDSLTMRSNPCVEAALRPFSFCNLTELNGFRITTQEEYNKAARAAAIIGTLQAAYTDFNYLRPIWRQVTEEDALIGVGITGIANQTFLALDHELAANIVRETNREYARVLGIRPAARCTLIKPSGTTSLVLGCSSGIHAGHSEYYLRRIRLNNNEAIVPFLKAHLPNFIEVSKEKPKFESIISLPCKAPSTIIRRDQESAMDLLRRVEFFYEKWVHPGWVEGENSHSISLTVSIKDHEWDEVGEWLWNKRDCYAGASVMSYSDIKYHQPPFEEIDEETFNRLDSMLPEDLPWHQIIEETDGTTLTEPVACAGGACEI
jgi:ribonucleoside-diphosphate reductase alpha chain